MIATGLELVHLQFRSAQCSQPLCWNHLTAFTNGCFRPDCVIAPNHVCFKFMMFKTLTNLSSIHLFSRTCVFFCFFGQRRCLIVSVAFVPPRLAFCNSECVCAVWACSHRRASTLRFSWMNRLFHPGSCWEQRHRVDMSQWSRETRVWTRLRPICAARQGAFSCDGLQVGSADRHTPEPGVTWRAGAVCRFPLRQSFSFFSHVHMDMFVGSRLDFELKAMRRETPLLESKSARVFTLCHEVTVCILVK